MTQTSAGAPESRIIRVFLSSTFRDFMEERDLLVRQVFPELRRKARERGVEVVEVDLRWGITEEESRQGKVLPICLAEINRCRPYFVGMLGERYGWVPPDDEDNRVVLADQPWVEEHLWRAASPSWRSCMECSVTRKWPAPAVPMPRWRHIRSSARAATPPGATPLYWRRFSSPGIGGR
jgi:hypothetical protein